MIKQRSMLLISNVPQIDLHGFDRDYARFMTKEFLHDQKKLGNKTVLVIHGKGLGILKKEVHEYLKHEKIVSKYYIDFMNEGTTVVELK